ncbi:hypothetical protein GF360_02690 [candidate division WWE3 bacterium]|nr:hypothetical protein [candidate division WWE3 bacterium]
MKRFLAPTLLIVAVAGSAYFLKRQHVNKQLIQSARPQQQTQASEKDQDTKQAEPEEFISPLGKSSILQTLGTQDTRKNDYTIYGYLPYWTIEETDNFRLENLTDVAYFGLYIEPDGSFLKTQEGEEGPVPNPGYNAWHNNEKLASFIRRAKRQNVDVALTIISHVDSKSTEFLNCEKCWETFYDNLKDELAVHKIDDVNLNFEYYETVDKETALKYTEFTKFVKRELNKDYDSPEVVVTTFADSLINDRVSHVPSLAKEADKLFIMAYDFHIMSADKAAPVSPMGGSGLHAGYDIKTMIKDYLSYAPPQKLILGVPYYGFNWAKGEEVVVEGSDDNLEGEVDGGSLEEDSVEKSAEKKQVEIIRDSLTQTYANIMELVEEENPEILWDEPGQVPYFVYVDSGNEETEASQEGVGAKERTVYFENEKSLQVKYRIAKEFDLAGVGIWALGYDADRAELWELLEREF